MRLRRWETARPEKPAYDRVDIVHGPPGSGDPNAPSCILSPSDEAELRDRIGALDRDQLLYVVEYFALSARGWARSVEPDVLIGAIRSAETYRDTAVVTT